MTKISGRLRVEILGFSVLGAELRIQTLRMRVVQEVVLIKVKGLGPEIKARP